MNITDKAFVKDIEYTEGKNLLESQMTLQLTEIIFLGIEIVKILFIHSIFLTQISISPDSR